VCQGAYFIDGIVCTSKLRRTVDTGYLVHFTLHALMLGISDPHTFHVDLDPGFEIFADPVPGLDFSKNWCSFRETVKQSKKRDSKKY